MTDTTPEQLEFSFTVDLTSKTILDRNPYRRRRSPILVDLNDGEITYVEIQQLIEAGMNVAKMRCSSIALSDRIRLLSKMDKAVKLLTNKFGVLDCPVASAVALSTCLVRTGLIENDKESIELRTGNEVILTNDLSQYTHCNEKLVFINNAQMNIEIRIGMEVNLDSGEIVLKTTEIINDRHVKCDIIKGGCLLNCVIVSVRGIQHSRPFIARNDVLNIKFAREYQVDLVIIYYARSVETIKKAKSYFRCTGKKPLIFAAISTEIGLSNVECLLQECDGLVLPREILPFEITFPEKMPLIQKWISGLCKKAGKPLILSGGVFESLIKTGKTVGHEVADVTNALIDGVTGFLLTKCFDVPRVLKTINLINKICSWVEPLVFSRYEMRILKETMNLPANAAEAAVVSCAAVAWQTMARLIVVPTVSGRTLKMLLKLKPPGIIITVCTDLRANRMMSIYRSVVPLIISKEAEERNSFRSRMGKRIAKAVEYAVSKNWILHGNLYVTLERYSDDSCYCDTVRIKVVDMHKKTNVECDDPFEDTDSELDRKPQLRGSVVNVNFI